MPRRLRTSYTHIPVANWFPPGDELATLMARLCALREDLYIETRGLHSDALPELDECSAEYRQIYFYRNQYRTLFEIMGAIRMLWAHKDFMAEVYRKYPKIEAEFDRLNSRFVEAYAHVKLFRDDVGGHLQHKAIRDGLLNIPNDTKCLFQEGWAPINIHYQFALEILGATMLRHVPLTEARKDWESRFPLMTRLGLDALNFVDILFQSYARVRNLSFS
jgi:hypothetical protein